MARNRFGALGGLLLATLVGCQTRDEAPDPELPTPTLRRLTATQYANSIHAVLGDAVVIPTSLEPDVPADGLLAVGASLTALSPRGVEQYETAAYSIAANLMDNPELRAPIITCVPQATIDDGCAVATIERLGRRLYRRPLTADESDSLLAIAHIASETLGDFYDGLEYALAAMLQSPNFLFRIELGENGALNDYELATRLAYFLWDTTPDDVLLDAAAAGELTTELGLSDQIDRMLADPRARLGLRAYFDDMLQLYELQTLSKDPLIFVHMSADVGPAAREESLRNAEWLVFDDDGDYRDYYTTRHTFVDRKLAAIYNIPAPAREGFGETEFPEASGRAGFLSELGFLAPNAHGSSSSVTLRGKFIRETLLCQGVPDPPADVNTAIPEASADAPTMRDRVAMHLSDPYCASCHGIMDPVGLGLENFDGLGSWRDAENGVTIDASGDLDGATFTNPVEVAAAVSQHADLTPCMVQTMYQYATGHVADSGEEALLDWHAGGFADSGYRVRFLLRDIALSPGFRQVGEVQ